MKKLILSTALVAAFAVAGHAQDAPQGPRPPRFTPEQAAQRQTDRMVADLGLNAEQKTRIYNMQLEADRKRMAAMDNARNKERGDMKAMRDARKAEQDAYMAQLKGILTPQQFTKYQALQEERRNKMRERMGDRGMRGADRPMVEPSPRNQ